MKPDHRWWPLLRATSLASLETYVDYEGSTRVRAFALDWEFRHARNPDVYPLYLPVSEWAEEFHGYCKPEAA